MNENEKRRLEGTWRRRKGRTRVTRERKIVAGWGGEIRSIGEASHAERQAEEERRDGRETAGRRRAEEKRKKKRRKEAEKK